MNLSHRTRAFVRPPVGSSSPWGAFVLLLFTAQLAVGPAAGAQSSPLESPPRVALVLSGGGARGGAHIGVLKVLEEANVQIDFVAGTSMGAIIGGLYASGWSPERIEEELVNIDWNDLLQDRGARRTLPFRRKVDDGRGFIDLEVGIGRGGVYLPAGMVSGQKFGFLLQRFLLHTSDLQSFDELPIPYRAVAASLDTGKAVVFDRGSLPTAIRASMSLPVIFAPVQRDGETLVDGGIVMNLPVELALKAGATQIIAVNVSTPLSGGARDASALAIAGRMNTAMMQENVIKSIDLLREGDILITPNLEGIRTTDFPLTLEAAGRGEVAARAELERIREMSVDAVRFERYLEHQRQAEATVEPVRIDHVEVSGLVRVDERQLTDRIRTAPGTTLDLDLLSSDLQRLYEIGEFQKISFDIRKEPEGNTLSIAVTEKGNRPGFMRLGLTLETQLQGSGDFSAFADYTRTQLNDKGAEWQSFFRIGDENTARTELYQPLTFDGRYFFAPRGYTSRTRADVRFDENQRSRLDIRAAGTGIDVGMSLRNKGELRLGGLYRVVDTDTLSGPDPMVNNEDTVALRFLARFDTVDNAFFPTEGYFSTSEVLVSRQRWGSDHSYDRIRANGGVAKSRGKNTLVGILEAGHSLGSKLPLYEEFSLGGFLNISGMEPGTLRGDEMVLGQIVYLRELFPMPSLIGSSVYLGGAVEAGRTWSVAEPTTLQDSRYSMSAFVGLDSILGPIYVGYGWANGGDRSFYFFLGSPFRRSRRSSPI